MYNLKFGDDEINSGATQEEQLILKITRCVTGLLTIVCNFCTTRYYAILKLEVK
jgi:hypothetical protein